MSETFKKLKKLFVRNTLIKSAVCGLSAGLFVAGVLLLSIKLAALDINVAYYVLAGTVVTAVVTLAVYFIMRPTDKSVARALDREYNLGEKVQTMVACMETEGGIYTLQREDAERRLSEVKIKKPTFASIWQYVLVGVLAVALFITSVIIPSRFVPSNADPDYEMSKAQSVFLRQLINDVKNSDLNEDVSSSVVQSLETLYVKLQSAEVVSSMKNSVIETVKSVDSTFASANSYVKITNGLSATENELLGKFSVAIVNGVSSYKTGTVINTIQKTEELFTASEEVINTKIDEVVSAFYEEWQAQTSSTRTVFLDNNVIDLGMALYNSEIDSEDALFRAINDFSTRIKAVSDNIKNGGTSLTVLDMQVKTACDIFASRGKTVVGGQSYNCIMDEFIRTRLAEIFSLKISELPSNSEVSPPRPSDPIGGGDENNNNGGGGGGGVNLGSDDLVYSRRHDKLVKYSEVINEYNNEMLERVQRGEATEEMAEYIKKYFEILYTGPDKTVSNDN